MHTSGVCYESFLLSDLSAGPPCSQVSPLFFNLFTVRHVTLVVTYALISFSLFCSYPSFEEVVLESLSLSLASIQCVS